MPEWTNGGRGVYVDDLVRVFQPPLRNFTQVPDATRVYRRALVTAADRSVTIASVGFVTNILALLTSPSDDISPLTGKALVLRKVKRLIAMGGAARGDRVEWNFGACGGDWSSCGSYSTLGTISAEAFANWPPAVPVVYLPFETGLPVLSGWKIKLRDLAESPCDRAYRNFCEDK